jgi:hypothetical protein
MKAHMRLGARSITVILSLLIATSFILSMMIATSTIVTH